MDAHVFRRFCAVLTELLHDARLEKIQSPAADVHIFTFYAQQRKHILVLRHDRRNPCIFLSPERYSTGQAPPARTMRLRKYAAGRRVKDVRVDWPARRLHMCFQLPAANAALDASPAGSAPRRAMPLKYSPTLPENTCAALAGAEHFYVGAAPYIPQPETWLSLDLRQGPELTLGKTPDFGHEPLWPSPADIAACLQDIPLQKHDLGQGAVAESDVPATRQAWEQWPVLTPALRRSLLHLDAPEQAALLADLEYGGGDIFAYSALQDDAPATAARNAAPHPVSSGADLRPRVSPASIDFVAWPLPPAVRGARREQIFEDPVEALAATGAHLVLGGLERAGQNSAASPHRREAKRLHRVLEKLDREECRLRAMVAGKDRALYVQSVLWYFSPEARPADLARSAAGTMLNTAQAPCVPAGEGANLPPCPFDPALLHAHLTLRENMEALFHGAARGQRGLAMLDQRRALLRGQVAAAEGAAQMVSLVGGRPFAPSGAGGEVGHTTAQKPHVGKLGQVSKKAAAQAGALGSAAGQRILPKNVEAFTSVDGLSILRGKDAKGNLALLKLGAPSDLWLHVEGGPGAHTLVRRASVGQEIPQATLEQAATLAAVKSWQKGNERVGVQCAEVRHVKPMRGAAMGTVRIDKVACMVWVSIPLLPA